MRLLLFFVSILFSGIFYIFYKYSKGINIFGGEVLSSIKLETLTSNLLIETTSFLILASFFIFYFSPINKDGKIFKKENFKNFYIIFYIFLIICYFSTIFKTDSFVFGTLVLFIFGDVCFNILSKLEYFIEQKIGLRILGLTLNYISSFIAIYYLFNISFSFFLFIILIFSAFFNFFVHKKYTNYISLGVSILISVFLLYFLILQVYYFVEKILIK